MGIAKYNKTRGGLFKVDTGGFEYENLSDLFDTKHPEKIFPVYGLYLGTFYSKKERREVDCCFAASEGYFISLPAHLVDTVREIRADDEAVALINESKAGLIIRPYDRDGETYYSADFVDVE